MVQFVWQRSGGNAILIEEIINALREGGPSVVPQTLRDMVLRRLNVLPPAVQHCVRVLAHGGEPVPHRVLTAVVDLSERDLVDAIRAAAAASLISADQTGDGYRFRHGIVQEVLIADALPGERIYVNRRYAEALETMPIADSAGAAQIAGHWYKAEEYLRAFPATVAAAEDAERLHGYAEASSHWLRALDLLHLLRGSETGFDEAGLTERAASAAHLAGDSDLAVSLLQQLVTGLTATPYVRYVRLHDQLGRYLRAAGRAEEACVVHQRAVATLPDDAAAGTSRDRKGRLLGGASRDRRLQKVIRASPQSPRTGSVVRSERRASTAACHARIRVGLSRRTRGRAGRGFGRPTGGGGLW